MNNQTSPTACENSNAYLKQYFPPNLLALIDKQKYQTHYKRGQTIIKEGFPVLGIYFIQNGKVKVFHTGYNGAAQIVSFANDGYVIGHGGLGNKVYQSSVVALEDSHIDFIKNDFLNKLHLENPKFTHGLMICCSNEMNTMGNRMKNIAHMNLREKIAEALLLVIDCFGVNEHNELNLKFTRQDIADTAGTTSEQAVRQLTQFEEEGLITKQGKKLFISDMVKLNEIVSKHNPNTSYRQN